MADISAVFGILVLLAVSYPGMLAALWLLFPATVERARLRLEQTPWQCFWLGGVISAAVIVPVVILLALPFGPAKFAGWALVVIVLSLANIGSAGLAAKMGERLTARSAGISGAGAFVRGALALELAIGFPVFGWLLVLPLVLVLAIGATGFTLLHWLPKTTPAADPAPIRFATPCPLNTHYQPPTTNLPIYPIPSPHLCLSPVVTS